MTDTVHVPFGDSMADTAALLLAAAEETKNEASVVVVDHFTNSYVVPEDVAKKAGADTFDPDADFAAEVKAAQADAKAEAPAPAKKAAAKKTAKKS